VTELNGRERGELNGCERGELNGRERGELNGRERGELNGRAQREALCGPACARERALCSGGARHRGSFNGSDAFPTLRTILSLVRNMKVVGSLESYVCCAFLCWP
jgi:hypothetical protein